MRGRRHPQLSMLAFVDLDARIPAGHSLRVVKRLADRALAELSPVFDRMYAAGGRPSIPPERLLKASLLIALCSIRSERAFCEDLEYHLLYRWFLDIGLVEPGFNTSTFTKNWERLLRHEVTAVFGTVGVRFTLSMLRALGCVVKRVSKSKSRYVRRLIGFEMDLWRLRSS